MPSPLIAMPLNDRESDKIPFFCRITSRILGIERASLMYALSCKVTSGLLDLGDGVEGEGRLAAALGAVDLDHTALGVTAPCTHHPRHTRFVRSPGTILHRSPELSAIYMSHTLSSGLAVRAACDFWSTNHRLHFPPNLQARMFAACAHLFREEALPVAISSVRLPVDVHSTAMRVVSPASPSTPRSLSGSSSQAVLERK